MRAIVVVTSVGTEEQANLIARELVRGRHAACVNILRGVRSVYRWQGKICEDGEFLLVIKTTEEEFESVSGVVRELHSYELPEVLAFHVVQGEPNFLQWIASSVDKETPCTDDEDELAFEEVD